MAKTLKIMKDMNEYKPGKFAQYSKKGFALAAQKLNKNGLLLWLFLCDNKNEYNYTLSPTAISNILGVSIDVAKSMTSASKGLKELEDAGFIKDNIFYAEGIDNSESEVEVEEKKVDFNF